MNIKTFTQKLKTHSLIIAILLGFTGFMLLKYVPVLSVFKPVAYFACDSLPFLLFLMLFFSFCKIEVKEMIPKTWHFSLALVQVALSGSLVVLLILCDFDFLTVLLIEGAIICFVTPTAASASVMTGKLGGNEAAQTTFTIISNVVAAIAIPLLFPLFCDVTNASFFSDFLMILKKVFPILVLPLILAFTIKRFFPTVHKFIVNSTKEAGFYLWLATLVVQTGRIFESISKAEVSILFIVLLFVVGLVCTIVQFLLGKILGSFDNQKVSAGQALGQKNTIFAIWIAIVYISPAVAIAPGSYLLWQNLVNAYQMWYRENQSIQRAKLGLGPYQE